MRNLDELFQALRESEFRSRFALDTDDFDYLQRRGLDVVLQHAETFLRERLAPARPAADGRQTPMRGHPAFVAQHATGACCRGCLEKWHGIEKGRLLTDEEIAYLLSVLQTWLQTQKKPILSARNRGKRQPRHDRQAPFLPGWEDARGDGGDRLSNRE